MISGEVLYEGKNLLELEPDERAREGVFMAFQYPVEVPGVSNSQFLRLAYNEKMKHSAWKNSTRSSSTII